MQARINLLQIHSSIPNDYAGEFCKYIKDRADLILKDNSRWSGPQSIDWAKSTFKLELTYENFAIKQPSQ